MIIGTAGHIDHGKTVLIGALTGVNTDRLAEEQKRGISIDLGFAEFTLPSGRKAGVVDVPGHEAFVKNMLAGATGFDLALIVVAADDGIMPQTREHVDIINLLGVKKAVFAVTKSDLVDAEMVGLVTEEIKDLVKGTPLAGAPIVPVSAKTGAGIDDLLKIIDEAAAELEEKQGAGLFRLPVDRVFVLKGAGTVVTGTLWSGSLKPDTSGVILPENIPVRIRSVQVHGAQVSKASAGNRVAVNLPGIDKDQIKRGDVLVPAGTFKPAFMIDAEFALLKDAPAPLKNRTRVRVHHGTAEIMARIVLLDHEILEPGDRAYVQLRMEKPIAALRGDRFIVRSYSPMVTIGGGEVIFGHARRHKRFDGYTVNLLDAAFSGDMASAVKMMLDKRGAPIADDELRNLTDLSPEEIKPAMAALTSSKDVIAIKGDKTYYVSEPGMKALEARIIAAVEDHHKANPLEAGISKETVKSKYLRRVDPKASGGLLAEMVNRGLLRVDGDIVSAAGHESAGGEQEKMKGAFEEQFLAKGLAPPSVFELSEEFRLTPKEAQTVLAALKKENRIYQVADGIFIHTEVLRFIEEKARGLLKDGNRMTVSEFRDAVGTSRKYAVPLLEYLDRQKITKRDGDYRVLA
jgi:selenocysteine-specific elongation factor